MELCRYVRNFHNVVICFNRSEFEVLKEEEKEEMRENFKSLLLDSYLPRVIHLRVSDILYTDHYEPWGISHEVIINKECKETAISQFNEFMDTDIDKKKADKDESKNKKSKKNKKPGNAEKGNNQLKTENTILETQKSIVDSEKTISSSDDSSDLDTSYEDSDKNNSTVS